MKRVQRKGSRLARFIDSEYRKKEKYRKEKEREKGETKEEDGNR